MKIHFSKGLFRVPRYLSLASAGVIIGGRSIRYVSFAESGGGIRLDRFGEIALPTSAMKDGDIADPDMVVKALGEVRKHIGESFVRIAVPEEKTYLFDTDIPVVKGTNVAESVSFKIEENVPLAEKEVAFEYDVIKKTDASLAASVSVMPKRTVAAFADACEKAGFPLAGLELESSMIARAVVPTGDRRALLLVDIGEDRTLLVLVADGIARFSSIADVTRQAAEAEPALLSGEIGKFSGYLSSKDGGNVALPAAFDAVVLSGAGANIPHLAAAIGRAAGAPAIQANVWKNAFDVNVAVPRLAFADSLRFAAAVGLALPGAEPRFLLSKERRALGFEYLLRTGTVFLGGVFATAIVLIAFFLPSYFFADYAYRTVASQAETAGGDSIAAYDKAASAITAVNGQAKALSYAVPPTVTTDIIASIVSAQNKDIAISSISIVPDASGRSEDVSLSGTAGNRDSLTAFATALKATSGFTNVNLPIASLITEANEPFTITLNRQVN
ncbi:MAG: pilus assembly protein PilM [Patescibacteria group bacterium]|nr:pilus assembly protein PilM [Patescibacteria group bacterium]MDE1945694.1 pilus assembly protein PilM [Patescibacteria group bacterium]